MMRTILNIFLVGSFLFFTVGAQAQLNIGDKLERKAKQRLDRKVDRTMDKGFDKAEQGVDKGAKEATKGKKDKGKVEKAEKPVKTTTRFDFVRGDEMLLAVDLSQEALGDFPEGWNTNSAAEVVALQGHKGRWLQLSGSGVFYPETLAALPERATVEFDVATSANYDPACGFLSVRFVDGGASKNLFRPALANQVSVSLHPNGPRGGGITEFGVYDEDGEEIMLNQHDQAELSGGQAATARVSLWRQKSRLRVYLDQEKVWDIPRAFQEGVDYKMLLETGSCGSSMPYVANVHVAQVNAE